MRGLRQFGIVFAVALAVAACGSTAATTAPAGAVPTAASGASSGTGGGGGNGGGGNGGGGGQNAISDICSVLTQAQVNTAAGGTLAAGAPQNDGVMCLWQDPNNGQVSVDVNNGSSTFESMCSYPGAVKVDGVGDGACFIEAGKIGTTINFKKGSYFLTINVVQPTGTVASIEAAEKTLAQLVAAKL